MAARFLIEEDEAQVKKELKEAFRFYDKEGKIYEYVNREHIINLTAILFIR